MTEEFYLKCYTQKRPRYDRSSLHPGENPSYFAVVDKQIQLANNTAQEGNYNHFLAGGSNFKSFPRLIHSLLTYLV